MSDTQDWTTMTAEQLMARGHKPVRIQHTDEEGWHEVPGKPRVEIRDWVIYGSELLGEAIDHPRLGNERIRTSRIVKVDMEARTVETMNTLYVLVGESAAATQQG